MNVRRGAPAGRWRARVALAVLLVLAAGGCRTDEPAGTGGVAPRAGMGTGAHPSSAASSPAATQTASFAVEVRTEDAFFTLPSGNIGCAMTTDGIARCDIAEHGWSPPPRPASCQPDYGDWGNGLVLSGNGVGFTCAGDTTLNPGGEVLAYGTGLRVGALLCVSSLQGVRCSSDATGHGFTLAREAYTTF